MRIALTIVIVLLIYTSWGVAYTQTSNTITPSRHTVGFPSDIENLLKLLEMLNISSIENIEKYKDVLKNIGKAYPKTSNITKALETYIDMIKTNSRASVEEVYNSINNTVLKQMFKDIVYKYSSGEYIDRTEIERILNNTQELYNGHMISNEDLLKALGILRTISFSRGYQDIPSIIDSRVSSIAMDVFNKLLSIANNSRGIEISKSEYQQSYLRIPKALPIVSPSISFAFPQIAQNIYPYILAILVIAIVIGISITIYKRFGRRLIINISRRLSKRFSVVKSVGIGTSISSKVIENYWRAVRIVEIKTGIHKYDWQTHREYEFGVREKLGNLGEVFSRITKIYEVVRYGGEDDSKYIDNINNILKRLEAS